MTDGLLPRRVLRNHSDWEINFSQAFTFFGDHSDFPFLTGVHSIAVEACSSGRCIHLGVISISLPRRRSEAVYCNENGRMLAHPAYMPRISGQSS